MTVGQFHNSKFDPVCVVYYGGKFYLRINAHGPDDKGYEIVGATKGTPFHLDFAIKWKVGDKACSMTVWKDGAKFLDLPAVTLLKEKWTEVFFKAGSYLNSTPALDEVGYAPLRAYYADIYAGLANKPNTLPPTVGTPTVPVAEPATGTYAIVADIQKRLSQLEGTIRDGYGTESSKYVTNSVRYLDLMVTKMRKKDAKA